MNPTESKHEEEIKMLKKCIQEKNEQLKKLEQLIEKIYALYGIKKETVYKTREDFFTEEPNYK